MKLSEIEEISASQKLALERQDFGLERLLLPDLPDIQSHALVLSGIRRCGKSTLLRQFVEKLGRDYFFLNFDDIRLASFNNADYALLDKVIADSGHRLIFFDEIQSAINWELYIRQKLDEGFQLVITGSNAALLSKELGTRLTGRHISKELFPFSYREFCSFCSFKAGAESFAKYLAKGGFPEFLKTENDDILIQLQSDILHRDIAVRYGIRDVSTLRRLFLYLISNPAQLFSPSKLTGIAGIKSPTTVLEYISYFESSYLIQLLPRFAWSVKAQSLAPKKVYIVDTGLVKATSFSFSANSGAMLENCVYNYLRCKAAALSSLKGPEIYYFTGKNDGECDFIFFQHEKPSCIQVCWELNTENQEREIRGLMEALEFFDLDNGKIITLDTEDEIQSKGKRIDVVPVWKYLS